MSRVFESIEWFQKFGRSTWFGARFNWRRTTCFISCWSTSAANRISIIFRTAHTINSIFYNSYFTSHMASIFAVDQCGLNAVIERNHLNTKLWRVIRQRSWDWRRIWWSRGFFQAWNYNFDQYEWDLVDDRKHQTFIRFSSYLRMHLQDSGTKLTLEHMICFISYDTYVFHFNSDQNDKYKFDKEASIKRILGWSFYRNLPITSRHSESEFQICSLT